MNPEDLIMQSANSMLAMADDAQVMRLTKAMLSSVGRELARQLVDGDEPGVLFNVVPKIPGATDPVGALLVLRKRSILAWSVGTLRPRAFSVVLSIDDPNQIVIKSILAKTWRLPERLVVQVGDGDGHEVVIMNVGNTRGALALAGMVVSGLATISDQD